MLARVGEQVPEAIRPWLAHYGPALARMSWAQLRDWIELVIAGRDAEAWAAVLERMDDDELPAQWAAMEAEWSAANQRQSQRRALSLEAVRAALRVLLTIAMAMIGL